ncbi:unnamed protein product, partial [Mesorhabditis belari]|uniref:Phosphatidic acid phosphatase type 2/haloperoxidase domain-containing protein n=1 Tax=Mesorhabditis belari TaxID=2138241 RepID=A0AAF3FGU5_9BILA
MSLQVPQIQQPQRQQGEPLVRRMSLGDVSLDDGERVELSLNRYIINVIVLYGLGMAVELLPYLVGPFERGFFCDDETIQYSYKGSTVNVTALYFFAMCVPLFSILWAEFVVQARIEKRKRRYHLRNRNVHSLVVHFFQEFGYVQLGLISVLSLMQVTKFVVGRLRPHFLTVCKIENLSELCKTDHTFVNIGEYTCTGAKTDVHEARLSFFSGHSAISVYTAFYAILYLQAKLGRFEPTKIFVSLVQTILLCAALVICYTRITDNWHHWSDVLVGIIVGILVAIWTALFWARLFERTAHFRVSLLPFFEKQDRNLGHTPATASTNDINSQGGGGDQASIDQQHL